MKYRDIRSEIKSGDLLSWSHRGWRSWYDLQVQFIRVFTRSEYSHVGAAYILGPRLFVLEAVSPRVRIFPLSSLLPFYWTTVPTLNWTIELEDWALNTVGQPYSKWHAIQHGAKHEPGKAPPPWQCAEWYREMARRGGIDSDYRATPTCVTLGIQRRLEAVTKYVEA